MTLSTPQRRFTRRRFLQLIAATAFGTAGLAAYGRALEPRWLDVEQVTLAIPRLPEKLIGKRIA
ncbi:MAG: metallophosphoesterase, partial [Chloroflexota bacterium]|nr:metallophosphoesterase [Chloroflexota bacterium]